MRSLKILIAAALLLAGPATAQNADDFWSQTRRGANSFNLVETPQHIAAAHDFGAGFVRMAVGKWKGSGRDFLAGYLDDYQGLQPADVQHLRTLLDAAAEADTPVVLTLLDLPGLRWKQNNGDKVDGRLWEDDHWHEVAARYWADIARAFRGHPGLAGYNLINEPAPELGQGLDETAASPAERDAWCQKVKGRPRDLDALYRRLVTAVRAEDPTTPILLDLGYYAQPSAARCLTALDDPHVLYAVHMYEPYGYTTWRWNQGRLTYPGPLDYGGRAETWDAARVARHLQPVLDWADTQGLARNRLMLGEFGCDRKVPGCAAYLHDVITAAEAARIHWAFYSFREDVWDSMDYELVDGPTPAGFYAQPQRALPRPPNPMSDVLRRGMRGELARAVSTSP